MKTADTIFSLIVYTLVRNIGNWVKFSEKMPHKNFCRSEQEEQLTQTWRNGESDMEGEIERMEINEEERVLDKWKCKQKGSDEIQGLCYSKICNLCSVARMRGEWQVGGLSMRFSKEAAFRADEMVSGLMGLWYHMLQR